MIEEINARCFSQAASDININNEADNLQACEMLSNVVNYGKTLKLQYTQEGGDLEKKLKQIKEKYYLPLDFIKKAECSLRSKINSYATTKLVDFQKSAAQSQIEHDNEIIKELDRLEAMKKEASKYDEATAAAFLESITDKQSKLINNSVTETAHNFSNDFCSFRKISSFEISDFSQIPSEFLMVNEKLVNQAIKDGYEFIPGINIYKKLVCTVR